MTIKRTLAIAGLSALFLFLALALYVEWTRPPTIPSYQCDKYVEWRFKNRPITTPVLARIDATLTDHAKAIERHETRIAECQVELERLREREEKKQQAKETTNVKKKRKCRCR